MKIVKVEQFQIAMPLAARYKARAGQLRMYDIDQHRLVKITADNGIVGYGDYEDDISPIPQSIIDDLIDRSPFDFLMNNLPMNLGMALYDLMGKALEVPVYRLFGQKVREMVPVGAWTRPCPPDVFAAEVERAAAQGYKVFKMHSDARWDVIEQTKAAEKVAPPGFKLHWDLNHNRTIGTILPIVTEMEKNHPIVGFIEDPLIWSDIEGWRRLREKVNIPMIMHVPQLGGLQEVIRGVADIYMIGGRIGDTMAAGIAYGRANVQCLIQQSGNALMRALSLHQAAVLPTASVHTITGADQYDEDITAEPIPVIEGASRVPEAPGLGVEVDEEGLQQAIERSHIPEPDFIGVLRLPGGHVVYSRGFPEVQRLTGREEGAIAGIDFEYWEDDGTPEFERVKARLESEGSFVDEG